MCLVKKSNLSCLIEALSGTFIYYIVANSYCFIFFQKWHRELDSRLPGQLGEVGAWLHDAEDALSKKYDEASNEEDLGAIIKKQMDDHRVSLPAITHCYFFARIGLSNRLSSILVQSIHVLAHLLLMLLVMFLMTMHLTELSLIVVDMTKM